MREKRSGFGCPLHRLDVDAHTRSSRIPINLLGPISIRRIRGYIIALAVHRINHHRSLAMNIIIPAAVIIVAIWRQFVRLVVVPLQRMTIIFPKITNRAAPEFNALGNPNGQLALGIRVGITICDGVGVGVLVLGSDLDGVVEPGGHDFGPA